ncbi:hypothetical protein OG562_30900 [Streptomyces sp. NBC_01275]|uniref:hypothetical protein n=1 Tax=Streptomyces sp. NBC_01275 TaxID=2903807 RepID=UPI002251589F|nr:hypothetical protein [Streptomyces sp. NBC_01275]MCX4765308.1 hypothetical protein [Streptomyces sp. NBC_01275]
MTETTTDPVVPPPATAPPPTPTPPRVTPPVPAVQSAPVHTPGGIPVLPLALSGTNAGVGAVSALTLVGGGPVALAAAVGGAAVLGTAAAVRARRDNRERRSKTNTGKSARRSPSPSRSAGSPKGGALAGGRGRGSGSKPRSGAGKSGSLRSLAATAGRHAARPTSPLTKARAAGAASTGRTAGGGGRVGQVRALRRERKEQAPTRAAARKQATAARRAVGDARRDARAAARAGKTAPGGKGWAGRAAGWAGGKTASGTRALVGKARQARDRSTDAQVDAKRSQVRKAPARRKARWGLAKSAARFQGRRLLAALVSGTAGALGCLTTPLGRKLGWRWLMHPGQRLYRRLMTAAHAQRAARDAAIRARRAAEEAAVEESPDEIGDRVARPARLIPTAPGAGQEIHVSGFKFDEAAAEMENAARTYEPDGNMEVLAMVDDLPTALLSVANTFRVLAERSDQEFAFEKDVATGFDDIHQTLLNAVDAAETLVPLFRRVHEQDIARHEDPRNGTEAEKGWNV